MSRDGVLDFLLERAPPSSPFCLRILPEIYTNGSSSRISLNRAMDIAYRGLEVRRAPLNRLLMTYPTRMMRLGYQPSGEVEEDRAEGWTAESKAFALFSPSLAGPPSP